MMKPFFTKPNLEALQSLIHAKTLFAFDFDGTLASVTAKPTDTLMKPITEQLISEFTDISPVAIISGRSSQDLKSRLQFHPTYIIGNHGVEGLNNNSHSLLASKHVCKKWIHQLERAHFGNGIEIEDKKYSISIHYRQSPNKKISRSKIFLAVATLDPKPDIIPGKLIVNLLPEGSPRKGDALLMLLKATGFRNLFYIGDDETDEDVFSLPYEKGELMTVRVGFKKKSNAQFFIERQTDINRLLRILIQFKRTLFSSASNTQNVGFAQFGTD